MADILLSVGLQTGQGDYSGFYKSIETIVKRAESGAPKVQVGIEISQSSLSAFKSQLTQIVNSIGVNNGSPIKVEIPGIGQITSQAGAAQAAVGKVDAAAKAAGNSLATMGNKGAAAGKQVSESSANMVKNTKAYNDAITKINTAIEKGQKALGSSILKSDPNAKEYTTNIEQQVSALQKLRGELTSMPQSQFAQQFGEIKSSIDASVSSLRLFSDAAKNVESAANMKVLANDVKSYNDAFTKTNNLILQIQNTLKSSAGAKNGFAALDYDNLKNQIGALQELQRNLANMTPEQFAKQFGVIKSEVEKSTSSIKVFGENTKSVFSQLASIPKQIIAIFGIQRIVAQAISAIKSMVNTSIELDSAMTNLQIVTGATDHEMETFLRNSTALAKELGASISDVTGSIEVFSRLGYSLADASELTKYATIMSNVAAVSTDEATTGLTSIIKGYNMRVEESEHVADVLVEVGQKYAVSASELMSAFERSGAALAASNTSFEKSAGLIAAANAAVQNANTVGRVLPIRTVMCA